ncbi:hypothetical protein CBOM_06104 [Ceraceosorus bombacis]|uniref:Uncharacterized protein n=1 Tax=Ceraceosorus bombacis TaxID=401625 RepID=A0A0N7LAD0_9BASI|nr:hypothetical protein CBOM_06104 [Ceraceosorus bombacis]
MATAMEPDTPLLALKEPRGQSSKGAQISGKGKAKKPSAPVPGKDKAKKPNPSKSEKEHCMIAITGIVSQTLWRQLSNSLKGTLRIKGNKVDGLARIFVSDPALRRELRREQVDGNPEDQRENARKYHWMRQVQCAAWHTTNAYHLREDAPPDLLRSTLELCEMAPEDREANVCEREWKAGEREEMVSLKEGALESREKRLEEREAALSKREADIKRREGALVVSESVLQMKAKSVDQGRPAVALRVGPLSTAANPPTAPRSMHQASQSSTHASISLSNRPQSLGNEAGPSRSTAPIPTQTEDVEPVFRTSLSPRDTKPSALDPSTHASASSQLPGTNGRDRAVSISSDSSVTTSSFSESTTSSESEISAGPVNPAIASLQRDSNLARSGTSSSRSSVGASSTDTLERLELRERNRLAAKQKAATLTRTELRQADRLERQVARHRARRATEREQHRAEAAAGALPSQALGSSSSATSSKNKKKASKSATPHPKTSSSVKGKESAGRGSQSGRSEDDSEPRFSEWERDLSSGSDEGSDEDQSGRRDLRKMFEEFYAFYKRKDDGKRKEKAKKKRSAASETEERLSKREKKRKRAREAESEKESANDITDGGSNRAAERSESLRRAPPLGRNPVAHRSGHSATGQTSASPFASTAAQASTSSAPFRQPPVYHTARPPSGPTAGSFWSEHETRALEDACRRHYSENRFLRQGRIYRTFVGLTGSTRTLAAVLQKASALGLLSRD